MTRGAAEGILGHELVELNDFPLGEVLAKRLAQNGIVTVRDLTLIGWGKEYVLPDDHPCKAELHYLPPLIEIRGVGWLRLQQIRTFLAGYGLALADEEALNIHDAVDEGP